MLYDSASILEAVVENGKNTVLYSSTVPAIEDQYVNRVLHYSWPMIILFRVLLLLSSRESRVHNYRIPYMILSAVIPKTVAVSPPGKATSDDP